MILPPLLLFLRHYPWGRLFFILLPLFAVLLLITVFVGTGTDVTLFFSSYRKLHPQLTSAMRLYTDYGNFLLAFVYLSFLVYGIRKQQPEQVKFVVAYLIAQLLISFLLVRIAKIVIGKPRPMPMLTHPEYDPGSMSSKYHSFPSGHTTEIVGAGVPLALRLRRLAVTFLLASVIALMGFSRVYLSRHHLSDIVGGCFFGSLSALVVQYFSLVQWRKK